jgi:hypothetical protein
MWFPLLYFALKMEKRDVDRQGDEAKGCLAILHVSNSFKRMDA